MADDWRPIPHLSPRAGPVEIALREHVERASVSGLPLYRMMQYQLGWVDRDGLEVAREPKARTLGSLCVEAASLTADGHSPAAYAGAAIELFQESVDVHEQMQTGEAGSDDHPAVWWVWGPAQAINVGDGLHALARLALLRLLEKGQAPEAMLATISLFDELALKYYEGQYIELIYQERVDITAAQYSAMVRSKQGALLGGTLALGARVSGSDDERVKAFWNLGACIGEAVQVRADIDSLWEQNNTPKGRVLNKSKLHPVVLVLESGTLAQKREIGGIYFKRVMEATDVTHLTDLLTAAGARELSEARVQEVVNEAKDQIKQITTQAKDIEHWSEIIDDLVSSSH